MQHAEKKSQPVNHAAQRQTTVASPARSTGIHSSPRMVAQQQQLRFMFGPAVQRVAEEEEPRQARFEAGGPIQREVKMSEARWGPSQGRWITTEAPGESFATKQEAEAREQEVQQAKEQAKEDAWVAQANTDAWEFRDQQGRLTAHFNDGWGESYGITSYGELRNYILGQVDRDSEDLGNGKTLDLGQCLNRDEHLSRPCKILYDAVKVVSVTAGSITRDTIKRSVYHCGPSSQ